MRETVEKIPPRPPMTSTGPAYSAAHFVCPVCGNVEKLPSGGDPEERPWCSHGDRLHWLRPEMVEAVTKQNAAQPLHRQWTQTVYAEVRVGEPHEGGMEPWGEGTS